jgi:hypothetical protein
MERKLNYEVKMRFFESPNFDIDSTGEEVVLARLTTKAAAEAFVRFQVIEILRYHCGYHIHDVHDIPADSGFSVDRSDSNVFCTIRFEEHATNIFNIERICPECGCNPQDEPYFMEPTHCPDCGFDFSEG